MFMHYTNQVVRIVLLIALLLGGGIVGCSFKHVEQEVFTTPVQRYSGIAVGDITAEDRLWEHLVSDFRRGFVETLRELKAFDTVLDPAPESLPESSVVLSGKITEVDKGSETLRWLIGLGAGRARVSGSFTLSNARGETLAKFEAREAYAGGLGIGGPDLVDMEDLMRRFGRTMAKRTLQWSRGEKIE
jgi:hypothetical protein